MIAFCCLLFVVAVAAWFVLPGDAGPEEDSVREALEQRLEAQRRRALEVLERRQEGGVQ